MDGGLQSVTKFQLTNCETQPDTMEYPFMNRKFRET